MKFFIKNPGRRRICIHCRAKHAREESTTAPVVAQQRARQHHTKELDLWNSTVLCTVCTVQHQRKPTGISTNLSRNWIRGTSNFSSIDCWNLSSMVTETSTLRKVKLPSICIPPWAGGEPIWGGPSWCGWCRPSTSRYRHSDPTRAANECHGRPCRQPE